MIWIESITNKSKYKRTNCDGSFRCPKCGRNFNWNNKRRIDVYTNGFVDICCKHCKTTTRFDVKENVV